MMIAPHESLAAAAEAAAKLSTIERQTRAIILEARKEAARITASARRRADGDPGAYVPVPATPAAGYAIGVDLSDVSDLSEGAAVSLDEDTPVEIRAGGKVVAQGRLGVQDGRCVLHVETSVFDGA